MALPLSYSLRNVRARPTRSMMTAGVIAMVVIAATLFLGLISSLKRTVAISGDPMNLVVMRKGSDNDGSSQLSLEAYQAIRFFDGIARDEADQPLASPELVVQPFLRTKDGGRENVLARGVEPVALQVHDKVRIVEGRMFQPSAGEAIVGRGVASRYADAELGRELRFGRGRWKVVGIFDADGSAFESEVWVDVRELANDAKRPFPYSGVRLRAATSADLARLEQRVDDDPRYALDAQRLQIGAQALVAFARGVHARGILRPCAVPRWAATVPRARRDRARPGRPPAAPARALLSDPKAKRAR